VLEELAASWAVARQDQPGMGHPQR
jgi:hypothetical protein